jgi:hypothetical protein
MENLNHSPSINHDPSSTVRNLFQYKNKSWSFIIHHISFVLSRIINYLHFHKKYFIKNLSSFIQSTIIIYYSSNLQSLFIQSLISQFSDHRVSKYISSYVILFHHSYFITHIFHSSYYFHHTISIIHIVHSSFLHFLQHIIKIIYDDIIFILILSLHCESQKCS